jgi:hypothetical protein
MNGIVAQRLGALGYSYAPDGTVVFAPGEEQVATGYSTGTVFSSGAGLPASSGGGLTPTEAALVSQGITVGGKVATQAIVGTPTMTYNPLTGQYTATGGATLPSTLGLTTTLTEYLPYLLLAGGLFLVLSMRR